MPRDKRFELTPLLRPLLLAGLLAQLTAAVYRACTDADDFFRYVLAGAAVFICLAWAARPLFRRLARAPKRALLLGFVAAAAGTRAISLGLVPNEPLSDFAIYHELSAAMLSGRGYALTGPVGVEDIKLYLDGSLELPRPTAFRAPGTALWGALLGARVPIFKAVNVLLGAGTCALIFLLMAGSGPAADAAAAALWAFYPSSVFATNLYGSEALFTFFLVLLAWQISRLASTAPRGTLAASGVNAAWCALIRPPWFIFPLILGLIWLWTLPKCESRRRIIFFAAFMGLALVPWAARNGVLLHRLVPISTNEGILLARQTSRFVPDDWAEDSTLRRLRSLYETAGEAERSALGYRIGVRNLEKTLTSGPTFLLKRLASNLGESLGSDTDMIEWASEKPSPSSSEPGAGESVLSVSALKSWQAINGSFYLGMILLAAFGVCRKGTPKRLAEPGIQFLALYFLCMLCMFAFIPGVGRYHFALMAPVAVFAGWGAVPPRRL
jgi:hypothetical protein